MGFVLLNWKMTPINTANARAVAPSIDPSDMYLLIATVIANVKIAMIVSIGIRIIITPRAVLTPFPPLNRKKTGKICPMIAANPDNSLTYSAFIRTVERVLARMTAAAPLPTSNISARMPANGPATRHTLVAPMFPDPTPRTSLTPNSRATIRPNGIDPSKYPSGIATNSNINYNFTIMAVVIVAQSVLG